MWAGEFFLWGGGGCCNTGLGLQHAVRAEVTRIVDVGTAAGTTSTATTITATTLAPVIAKAATTSTTCATTPCGASIANHGVNQAVHQQGGEEPGV